MVEPRTSDHHITLADIRSLGKSPVVEDGGRIIAESGAIIGYILRNCGSAAAPSDANYDDYICVGISAYGCLKWL
jgi:glutathione S-transferase